MRARRVAVTGLGVVAPLGCSPDELFDNLTAGRSGIGPLPSNGTRGAPAPIGAAVSFDGSGFFPAPRLRMLDRVTQMALIAAQQAIADADIDFTVRARARCGVFVGTGLGGATTTAESYRTLFKECSDRLQPYSVLNAMNNAPAAWIAIEHGLEGPNLTFSTACSSSAVALGEAARRIESGEADFMVAGGAETPLLPGVLRAWDAMRTLAAADARDPSASCRPFARTRTGLVLGEGAAFAVLEEWQHARARQAPIHAELTGYGLSSDIAHITRPTVEGQARAMRAALAAAGLTPEDIGYINAHGTATLQNDVVETAAIKSVFGSRAGRIPVSSTKSMHGHLLGAAGALEFVIAVMCLRRDSVPPTMHLDSPDPACDLDYVADGARRGLGLRCVMSNSFAFGGTNAALVLTAADTSGATWPAPRPRA
jgi:3-oxoacyl-[acyl-carrier-protein] synthase II